MSRIAIRAKTMGAALSKVKKDFGDDAYIESTTEENGEVLLTVITSDDQKNISFPPHEARENQIQHMAVVKKATPASAPTLSKEEQPSVDTTTHQPIPHTPQAQPIEQTNSIQAAPLQTQPSQPTSTSEALAQTTQIIKKIPLSYRIKSPLAAVRLIHDLCELHGLDETFCEVWLQHTAQCLAEKPIDLSKGLKECVTFDETWLQKITPSQPLVFIGAPGSGKTSILAKVAVHLVSIGVPIFVVNLDILKVAAGAQLEGYMRPMQQTVHTGEDALKKAHSMLKNPGNNAVILIDTPSINVQNDEDMHMLNSLLLANRMRPTLVLGADTDAHHAGYIGSKLSPFNPYTILTTKCDAATSWGASLMAAFKSGSSLSCISTSPKIGDALTPFDVTWLIEQMLQSIPQ